MPLDFHRELLDSLKDPREASAYLQAFLLDGDAEGLLIGLNTLAQARGGLTLLSKKTGLDRVHLYRMLGKGGNPSFKNVMAILDALGVKMDFSARRVGPLRAKRTKIKA